MARMQERAKRLLPLCLVLAAGAPRLCEAWSRIPGARIAVPTAPQRAVARTVAVAPRVAMRVQPQLFNGTWPCNTAVTPEMTIRLFPGFAQQLAEGEWLVSLRGWVCDSQLRTARRRLTSTVLQRGVWTAVHNAGDASEGGVATPSSPRETAHRLALLRRRIGIFLTRSHARIAVPFMLTNSMGEELWSTETNSAGHFTLHATVPEQELLRREHNSRKLPGGTWLTLLRTAPTEDGRVFETAMLLIPPVGLSVISDIDDTIKQTHVHDTRLMLRSTFLEDWAPVAGMQSAYRAWAAQGAVFHYVSSSPWQLQPQLEAMLSKAGFPPGTFHLKDLHYKGRRLLNLFRSSAALKPKQICSLLKSFPLRRFILVGDAGEKDAQIYAQMARQHHSQISHVYIRNVPSKRLGAMTKEETRARLARSFRGLPDHLWTVFDSAQAIEGDAKSWPWPAALPAQSQTAGRK